MKIHLLELPKEPIPANHSILACDHQTVHVQGFWTPLSETTGVLACHPNLKSCCAGHRELIHRQIFVHSVSEVLPIDQIVVIEGMFSIHSENQYLYQLEYHHKIKESKTSDWYFLLLYIIVIGWIILRIYKIIFKRMKNRFLHY